MKWCDEGIYLLASQPVDKCQSQEGAEAALQEIEKFLETGAENKIQELDRIYQDYEPVLTTDLMVSGAHARGGGRGGRYELFQDPGRLEAQLPLNTGFRDPAALLCLGSFPARPPLGAPPPGFPSTPPPACPPVHRADPSPHCHPAGCPHPRGTHRVTPFPQGTCGATCPSLPADSPQSSRSCIPRGPTPPSCGGGGGGGSAGLRPGGWL